MAGSRMLSSPTDPALVVPASRSFANAAFGRFRRVSGERDRRSPRKRKYAKAAAQEACTRHTLLLKKLFERAEAASGDSPTLARHLSAGAAVSSASPRCRARSRLLQWQNSSKSCWIESPSARGRREESTKPTRSSGSPSSDLSLRFARETPPSAETKAFHRKCFAILEDVTTRWTRRAELSRPALVKRLERARKIHLLARCFGEQVLTSEALTMRLVDRTTFQSFSILLQEAAQAPRETESEEASAKWTAAVPGKR